MNKSMVFENNLQKLLDEHNLNQKDLAKMIGEREASISEFIKLKRSTINIDLILKIATALKIEDISIILSLKKVITIKDYEQNKWYTLSTNNMVRFAYICGSNEETFEIVEIMDNGVVIHQKYSITEYDDKKVMEEFEKIKVELPDNIIEDDLTLMLIELCRYEGEQVSLNRYKTVENAIETVEMLY